MKGKPGIKWWLLVGLLVALVFGAAGCSGNYSIAYQKAIDTFAGGDYVAAATAFEKLKDYGEAPVYAAYSRGLTLFEQGFYTEAAPYFEKSQEFMYGASRYAYCNAHILEESGEFAAAAEGFQALGEFEDAMARENYCKARIAEADKDYTTALYGYEAAGEYSDAPDRLMSLQNQMYQYAIQLKEERKYQQALVLFGLLGDYLSSAAQAKECKDFFREDLYAQGEQFAAAGRVQEAYDAFKGLSGYRDSESWVLDLGTQLGIFEETDDME